MLDKITEYLTKLLNKKISIDTDITLSSAQRARFHAWLATNQIDFDENVLAKRFTIENLLTIDIAKAQSKKKPNIDNLNHNAAFGSVGIDIQRIDELFPNGLPADPKSDNELMSIFNLNELSYAQSKDKPIETLAGIFTVKEAIQKCASKNLNLIDISVTYNLQGAPISQGYNISLSHSGNYAVAIATPLLNIEKNHELQKTLMESGPPQKIIEIPERRLRFLDLLFLIFFGVIAFVEFLR